jgi:hypothetical protein
MEGCLLYALAVGLVAAVWVVYDWKAAIGCVGVAVLGDLIVTVIKVTNKWK